VFREIKKRKIILDYRKPYTDEAIRLINEINQVDWIFTSMRLDGSNISRDNVQRIVKGEFVVDVKVNDHSTITNYQEAIRYTYSIVGMKAELDEKDLFNYYKILSNNETQGYRRTNPILLSLDYNPPHPSEIEEQMELLFQWIRENDFQNNPILKAAYLHNKIIEIYPYESYSESIARMAMYSELIINGYPPVLLNLSESEYYDAIRSYLKKEKIQPMYNPLERAVYNKLEVMMQLTADQA
jgi:Fic family protein